MYQVLARTWRPQTFDELVGQRHVARALGNAITGDRLAHAYIFAGLRGTGKTTVARILAKCLNCNNAKGPTATPCGSCAACSEIAASRAMDVLEIDAASRTKVEQTRELLEMVSYAPVRDRYKILIIDEAHMLSKASFNALLKTLEEPPPNVMFVLATTEIQKVLPTILSRCQIFEFRRVTAREVAEHLRKMCDAEGIEISDQALERLARAGEGSVRDSISALERVLAFCGKSVEDDDVLRMLGAVRAEVLNEIVAAFAAHDAGRMLTVLDGLVDEGHDLVHFWSELIAAVRDLLLLRTLPDRTELLSRSPEESSALANAANGLSREDLSRIFQILAELEPGLKSSSQPQFLFEATLIRLSSLAAVRPIEEVLASIPGEEARRAPVRGRSASPPEARRTRAPEKKKTADVAELLSRLHDARPMLAAVLEQASSVELDAGVLHVRFEAGMEALKRTLEQPDSLTFLRRETGPLEVRAEIGPAADAAKPASPSAANEPDDSRAVPPRSRAPAPRKPTGGPTRFEGREVPASLLERIQKEPAVGKLLDAFGAQVVDVRPLEPSPEKSDSPGPTAPMEEK